MADNKILFVAQEITPYMPSTELAQMGNFLPQALHGSEFEVRTFMPKFGVINERRNQLHEVIRLSGVNIPIADNDHPLIIKVASMQPSRIQVYFIDNDDYFQKADSDADSFGSNRSDNDERAIFFARGAIETAKKLSWTPTLVHYNGWFTALGPLYLKRLHKDDPSFKGAKTVFSVSPADLEAPVDPAVLDKLKADGIPAKDIKRFKDLPANIGLLQKIGMTYADGVVFEGDPHPELLAYAQSIGVPFISLPLGQKDAEPYKAFYSTLLPKKK